MVESDGSNLSQNNDTRSMKKPRRPKLPSTRLSNIFCAKCSHIIVVEQSWITCRACVLKFHIDCACVTQLEYECLKSNSSISWCCQRCNEEMKKINASSYDTTEIITELKAFKDMDVNVASIRNELDKFNEFHSELMDLKRSIRELVGKQSFEFKKVSAILAEVRELILKIETKTEKVGLSYSFDIQALLDRELSIVSSISDKETLSDLDAHESKESLDSTEDGTPNNKIQNDAKEFKLESQKELLYSENTSEKQVTNEKQVESNESQLVSSNDDINSDKININQDRLLVEIEKRNEIKNELSLGITNTMTENEEIEKVSQRNEIRKINKEEIDVGEIPKETREGGSNRKEYENEKLVNEGIEGTDNISKDDTTNIKKVSCEEINEDDKDSMLNKEVSRSNEKTDKDASRNEKYEDESKQNKKPSNEKAKDAKAVNITQKQRLEVIRSNLNFEMQNAEQDRINRRKQAEKRLFQDKSVARKEKGNEENKSNYDPNCDEEGGILEIKPIIEKFEASSRKSKLTKKSFSKTVKEE